MEKKEMAKIILWMESEIRELDELCRSMVPGYAPLDSDDITKLKKAKLIAARVAK